ncbi:MAG TPA: hypothetical protein DCY93_03560 [Firmicutes bacterium]|nr:hypothetical protein [Bacillota bacterium]
MDQYQILDNLMDLYSADEDVRLEALLAKKEWILDRFYVPYSLISTGEEEYSDLLALKNKALPFHKITLKGVTTKYLVNIVETFNRRFRRLRMYENLPSRSQRHIFYVQVDFRKLDKDDYKVLVPLFFYCLRKDVVSDVKLPNDIRKVIALAIEGQDNEAMQIVDIKHLEKNIMKVDGFKKIYAYDDMSEKELESVKGIAKYLHLPLVMVHAKNK